VSKDMSASASNGVRSKDWSRRRGMFYGLLLLFSALVAFGAIFLPLYTAQSSLSLEEGRVAAREIVAPRTLTFTSEILTERQRQAAANAVPPIFTPPDTSVARRQLDRLRATLAYITSVRSDTFATLEQKLSDLAALEDIHLDQTTAQGILNLSEQRWQAVQQEAIVVLEQVMRSTIRQDRLEDVRRGIPPLVSLSLPEEQASVVVALVQGFIAPNSFYSEELTEAARKQARDAVTPVERTFIQGETILQRGQVVSETDIEALEQFGLVIPRSRWQDLVAPGALVLLTLFYFFLYLRRDVALLRDLRRLTVITVLFLIFLVVGRALISSDSVIPYLYPLSAFSLVVASLFGTRTALVFSLPLSILYAYDTTSPLDLMLYSLFGGFCGAFALGSARHMTSFFWAAAATSFAEIAIVFSFRLPQSNVDLIEVVTLSGVALVNGIAASSLTVLLQYLLAQFLGLTTALQLMEISRPDHPLLQLILRNAPGTYQHSLQVANLAEQAAEVIGADTLLTRVGSLYHDAGKALNPYFFIENQLPGNPNPHENLDPVASAQTIIRHVHDGLELARKYRLPRRIQDFIAEHHGTMTTSYQYAQAVKAVGGDESKLDENLFCYPGPRPRSRETAILMLADGSEATVRAERPKDEDELHETIKSVVEHRLSTGQLDETNLTLRDLDMIIESFTTTLRGIYHPRLEYPKFEKISPPTRDSTPTVPIISRKTPDTVPDPRLES